MSDGRHQMIDPQKIRRRVQEATQRAGDNAWLVGYDINGIQELITASNRPITMRGASKAIKDFDLESRNVLSIFSGGGRGIELAASEADARKRIEHLITTFAKKTCGGVLAAAAVPYNKDAEDGSITWLRRKLEIAKDAACSPTGTLPSSKDAQCADCSALLAEKWVRAGDDERHVCARCELMINLARGGDKAVSKSLVDYAREGRLAAISADGNNLGAFFASLSSLKEMAAASEVVADIFQSAHQEALGAVTALDLEALDPVIGGDDIRVFVAPEGVLPYVEALVRGVERKARTAGDVGGLLSATRARSLAQIGIGIGAAVAGDHYPASKLMELAHDRERAAKVAGLGSVFDFVILASSDASTEYSQPVSMDEESWAATRHAAEAFSHVPSAQRAVLSERRTLAPEEFENLLRYQVARSDHWKRWFTACNVDWTQPTALRPLLDRVRLDLLDLLPRQEDSE